VVDGTHRIARSLVACLTALSLSACLSVPRGSGLGKPSGLRRPVDRMAWIDHVKISDFSVDEKNVVENSLTINLLEYTREGNYFRAVNLLPGELGDDSVVLHFEFQSYEQKRSVHPAYFPLALLTLTLYIWFGGPIGVDSTRFFATLLVEDREGRTLAEARAEKSERHNVSFWSPDYALPSGIEGRTATVKDLLDQCHRQFLEKES